MVIVVAQFAAKTTNLEKAVNRLFITCLVQ